MPEAVYLYASKAAYVYMSVFDIEDIKLAYALAYDGSSEDILRERFMLSEEVIEKYDAAQHPDKWDYIVKHTDKIIAKASLFEVAGYCLWLSSPRANSCIL